MSGWVFLVRNYPVKFAILAARILGADTADTEAPSASKELIQDYLDLSPEQGIVRLLGQLDDIQRGIVMFGFSNQAILDILDEEFEVDMDTGVLVFRKPFLDARSIRLAGGGRASGQIDSFTPREQSVIESLTGWLLDATRSLYRGDLSETRLRDIREEYTENFGVYARKCVPNYEPGDAEVFLRSLFVSLKTMRAFGHSLTVDAMFKADAAKVLFGENSGYHQAWLRKQVFRHMMSKAIDQYIVSCTA